MQGLHYVICTYNVAARSSAIFRDEDICFPLSFDNHFDIQPKEIVERLQKVISDVDSTPKSGSKSQDQRTKDLGKCFKLMYGLVVIVMYTFDHRNFNATFIPELLNQHFEPEV